MLRTFLYHKFEGILQQASISVLLSFWNDSPKHKTARDNISSNARLGSSFWKNSPKNKTVWQGYAKMTVPVARSALLLHISAIIYLKCILLDPIKRRFFSRNCILFGRMPQVLARTKDFWFRDGNHAFVCPELLQRPENVKYVWILCKNAESSSVLTGAMTWNYSNETYREYEICGSLAKTVFPYVE